MNKTLNELIKEAYDIAQKKNHCFTYDEAKIYDPVISVLFQALTLSDELLHDEKKTINDLTLDNIFNNADYEELSAIVHSIIYRINEKLSDSYYEGISDIKKIPITDKEISDLVKELRLIK